ncbi:BRAP2 RING ZnF UBP domain-containing protein 1 isoform X2 [Lotus japonicus]|uniref:BRAP2 RING ZnF UBP domain-containing protein 1 isoform X2 n=1 Tax=Lotus japonicus TaxID=34305 RepID=UPI00258FFB92|nr:BRAP2 RING ZnF UBP domain-containing protein 1 isoform X2 [Lotus japonicus]
MFLLRVHSVEADHPLDPQTIFSAPIPQSHIPKFTERRGFLHLFRTTTASSSSSSLLLFILAVPNYLSFEDFIRFCNPHLDHLHHLLFIRNDGMEDRYSVLIEFHDQVTADGFYSNFNGKKFSPGEAELCHILSLLSVEYSEFAEVAGTPPVGCTEIPTCPVCLERLDPDTSGILKTLCDHSFQCPCVSKWTYLSCQVCQFCQQQDEKQTCFVCGTLDDVWVCMICGFVGCGRYKEGHAIQHWKDTQHCYSLDFKTQQIWDYVGDNYVHRLNQNQSKIDGKLEEMNSRCVSLEGDCDSCECPEDLGINGALINSKVEAIVDEYNRLLASQLETQRQHYESLLVEAKSKAESSLSEAVEKAATSEMQDIQNELEKCTEERDAVAEVNRKLIKNQEMWRNKVKEAEQEATSMESFNERKLDLEEQIRDIKIFLEAQKTIDKMSDSNGIKDGTVLPVAYEQSSSGNSKKNRKSGRRRN